MRRYALSDDQFARIEHLLPGRPGHVGRNSDKGNRLFVEAVIWEFRTGAPWRDLPERFGNWKNTHKRFSRWAESGVWESLLKTYSGRSGQRVRHDRCNHRQSPPAQRRGSKKGGSNEAIGRSRGGLTTKIHTIVDALGNPLAVSLTGGHVHDVTQAQVLTQEIEPAALLADKGYDSDGFLEHLEVRCIKPVIPPRANRKTPRECDFALYCERNLVERFFNNIKHFRAIATRYEKTARNFLAGVHLVCALAWLK